ncbi:uncharacterized protein DNG_04571 [Cephalotrichum gorgonifer]|uniref:Uncharacterized protein n=1 Tax=Cephalotrichum gorgonifer TaxID=2041049 RepID=A0AAE8MYR8_9PEZI|nr:uncharacterized protein DNG_04571 [Cephalotrichum gorgonifer]
MASVQDDLRNSESVTSLQEGRGNGDSIGPFLAQNRQNEDAGSWILGPWLASSENDRFNIPDTPPPLHDAYHQRPLPSSRCSVVSSSTEVTTVSSVFSAGVPTNARPTNSDQQHPLGASNIRPNVPAYTPEPLSPELPTFQSTIAMRSYRMPCEFARYTGCTATFDVWTECESWIHHELEAHLGGEPPAACLCWFCDDFKFIADQTHGGDVGENFHSRMIHIASHFQDGADARRIRPDFFFLDHLWDRGLISRDVFDREKGLHEAIQVEGLRPRGYKTERMVKEEERKGWAVADIRSEERHRRRVKDHNLRPNHKEELLVSRGEDAVPTAARE